MTDLPDWAIVLIGLGAGGFFTLLGGLLQQRREKARLAHEDIRLTRESIAKTYIEGAIQPMQKDIARNLSIISEIQDNYDEIAARNEELDPIGIRKLLDRISAIRLQWDQEARALGVARVGFFGSEFQQAALAGYRAVELYDAIAHWLADDLRDEIVASGYSNISNGSIKKVKDMTNEGKFCSGCLEATLRAITDLDLLAQAIHALEMESYLDVMLAKRDIEPLASLREVAREDVKKFEKFEQGGWMEKKKRADRK